MIIRLVLLLAVLCSTFPGYAQSKIYSPFVVDSAAVTALLPVSESNFTERFVAVFQKHGLDASSTSDWYRVLQQIARRKETDAAVSKEVSLEATEDGVELVAINFDNLEQMVKTLRLVIASPEKLDTFLGKAGIPNQ